MKHLNVKKVDFVMSELYCKWVSKDMKTMNRTCWDVGVTKKLPEQENLRVDYLGLFHYYRHPLLAVIFKGDHGCGAYKKLYAVKPEGVIVDRVDMSGATTLTLIEEIEAPKLDGNRRIAFFILCALEVCKKDEYVFWAKKWLSGADRSQQSAEVAAAKLAKNTSDLTVIYGRDAAYYAAYFDYYIADISNEAYYGISLAPTINLTEISKEVMKLNF